MTQAPVRKTQLQPTHYQLGVGSTSVGIDAITVAPLKLRESYPPKIGTGFDIDRSSRRDVLGFRMNDYSGGMAATSGIYDASFKNRAFVNQGLVALRPGELRLPNVCTAQTAMDNIDISGFYAAAKRVHAIMSSNGVSGQRLLLAIGTKVYSDTSLTDPAIALRDDALTDSVLSIANLRLNSVDYTAVSTDGTTDDTAGASDITAATPFSGGTKLITHAHADDGMYAMDFFPTLGGVGYNIFAGVLNQVNGLWAMPSTAAVPLTSATMLPVNDKDTADILNSASVEYTLSNLDPTTAGNEGQGTTGDAGGTQTGIWTNVGNIFASDDADASYLVTNAAGGTGITSWLHAGGFATSTVPLGARLTGLTLTIEHAEANALNTVYLAEVQLFANGQQVGNPRSTGDELGTVDSTDTLGGASDDWGTGGNLTGSQIRGLSVRFRYVFSDATGTADEGPTVDHVRITSLKYKLPGTQTTLQKGLWSPGKPAHVANTLFFVHPASNEETTIFKPRLITVCQFEYDSEGERILCTKSQPPIGGMASVDEACSWTGGWAIAGGTAGTHGISVKHIQGDLKTVRDLGFPAVHGTAALRVCHMETIGAVLVVTVCNADSTDAQRWMYFGEKWMPYSALYSKVLAGAMSTQPLPWAEKTNNTHQSYSYDIYPSSTNTAVIRQFVPPDPLNADSFLVNTAAPQGTKENGPLYWQSLELEPLPAEAINAIMNAALYDHRADDNTSYGSVRLQINTLGDPAFATSQIDITWDASSETMIERNLATLGDPGVDFQTMIVRVTLDHQAGTTETPNVGVIQINMVSDFVPQIEFELVMVDERLGINVPQSRSPMGLMLALESLINTKVAMAFHGLGRNPIPVKIVDVPFRMKRASMGTAQSEWDLVSYASVKLIKITGATTSN